MSTVLDNKPRPFSADIARVTKVRLQSSNCPTILKHEISNPAETFQPFMTSNTSEKQLILDRPRTATNATKMKFSFLQNMKPLASPLSGTSIRPMSGAMNSTINFDFLATIGKTSRAKFQDKSKIKPPKKLNTNQFHNVIYKVKQQKEILEKEINRMEQWHKDFKENDIWNTPQTAIIESIMRQNAKSNPDGSVSKYLQTEKDRDDFMKATKKNQRPTSSYSYLNRKAGANINNAKSVKDFFGPDDNGEIIEEIIGAKKHYYSQYNLNKRKITDQVNSYVDNVENYHTLMHNTKEFVNADPATKWRGREAHGVHESKEASGHAGMEDQGRSISEIVESCEDSEITPHHAHMHVQRPATSKVQPNYSSKQMPQGKNRPVSAKMLVNTVFSPKDFASAGILGQALSPQEIPSSIHTRPQTAKQVRVPVTATIASGLVAMGEPRQESVSSVKFVPISMEGQKIPVEPYNLCLNKSRELMSSSKGFTPKEEGTFVHSDLGFRISKTTKSIQTSPSSFIVKSPSEMREQEVNKVGQRRVMSGKANMKTCSGTQTQTQTVMMDGSASIGKLNIDGEYFQSFKENTIKGASRTTTAGDRKKISILDSWVTKESKPFSRFGQERDLL